MHEIPTGDSEISIVDIAILTVDLRPSM